MKKYIHNKRLKKLKIVFITSLVLFITILTLRELGNFNVSNLLYNLEKNQEYIEVSALVRNLDTNISQISTYKQDGFIVANGQTYQNAVEAVKELQILREANKLRIDQLSKPILAFQTFWKNGIRPIIGHAIFWTLGGIVIPGAWLFIETYIYCPICKYNVEAPNSHADYITKHKRKWELKNKEKE